MKQFVLKRDGRLKELDLERVQKAIGKAYVEVYGNDEKFKEDSIILLSLIERKILKSGEKIDIETIQNIIVHYLSEMDQEVWKAYSEYRERRTKERELNSEIFKSIAGIVDGSNKNALNENGNKKGELNSVQRDLIAGEVSRAMARKIIPSDLYKAHEEGVIHFHDADYLIQNETNCELINLKDMLDNGTVINGKLIESPNSLRTAMNVATQISAVVASNTFGGQTMSISHLAPYLRKSIIAINKKYEDMKEVFKEGSEEIIKNKIDEEIKKEIRDSVQTLSYQLNTLSSTNGQTPFVSLCLYLNEDVEYIKETAMLIEEVFNQRMLGIKNENGVYETPPFPKLLYFLDENNTYEGSEYFWLTKLSAECQARRMNPDFISVKRMKELIGFAFPCIKSCA